MLKRILESKSILVELGFMSAVIGTMLITGFISIN
jgi:hypothetical protein